MNRWFLAVSLVQVLCAVILFMDRKQFTKYSQWSVIVLVGGFFMIWIGALIQVVANFVL